MADGKGSMARQPVAGAGIARPPVHRITVAQLAVLVPLCLITWLVVNSVSAYSLLCGALVSILPQAWFASIAFRRRGARRAQQAARMVYAGEFGKFLLSVAGFALAAGVAGLYLAWRRGFSVLEMASSRADAGFVAALRRRFGVPTA